MLTLKSYQPGTVEWLQQTVTISWFTDARADADIELDDVASDRRGYWGDSLENFKLGSLLWTLKRKTITTETINKARDYARDGVLWLPTTPWVNRLEVDAFRVDFQTIGLVAQLQLPTQSLTVKKEWSNA